MSFNGKKLALSLVALVILWVRFALPTSASPDDWPMFRFNAERTGATPEAVTPPLTPLWIYDIGSSVESSPAVSGGVLYVAAGNGKVYALNAMTGAHIWNYTITTLNRAASSPAVVNGVVYIGSWDDPQSRVFALDATTGAHIWNSTAGTRVYSSPAVSGGVVYVGSLDSNVYAFDATTGAQIWNYATGDQVHSSPAVSGGIVYVGSDDSAVYALNATTGALIWSRAGGDYSCPAVSGGVVYVGSFSGWVYAYDAITGALIWSSHTMYPSYSSPAVSEGVVYIGASPGFYALDATTGAQIWNYSAYLVLSAPAVSGDVVYFGSYDHNIYALNAATGAHIWSYETGGEVFSSPAVSGGVVYVGSYDGKVYAFAEPVPDFTIALEDTGDTVTQGESTAVGVTIFPIYFYSEIVSLSASGQPAGVSVSFDPESGTPSFNSDMTISVGQDVEPNTYSITITGTGADEKVHTAIFELTVTAALVPDFSIVLPQTSDTVTQGESTSVAVTVTSLDGYSEVVTLSASGQPAAVSVSFDPESGTPSFDSDMTMSVGREVEANTYSITITGTGADEKVHTTTFELTVTEKTQSLLELLQSLAPWIALIIIVIIIIIILILWKWR